MKIDFGKYKGTEVEKLSPSYGHWLWSQDFVREKYVSLYAELTRLGFTYPPITGSPYPNNVEDFPEEYAELIKDNNEFEAF